MATKKLKEINLVCGARVCGGELPDPPEFVVLNITKKMLTDVLRYLKHLVAMEKDGLDPDHIEEFNYASSFMQPSGHNVLNKEEKATLLFESKYVKSNWLGGFEHRMFTELAAAELLRKLTDAINYTIESPPSDVR